MRLHVLSLKVALGVAGAALLLMLAARLAFGLLPWWGLLVFAGLVGGAAYVVARRLLARRLMLARTTLRRIRKHQFERLEAPRTPQDDEPHGDELSALVWQVYRTGQALEEEIRELKKMENYRREFIGNVSHELKTPIFAIQGFAETLLEGALEDERVRHTFVEKILRNAGRMDHLARDLAEIARIETGELQMTPALFELEKLVREACESLEVAARAGRVTLRCQIGPHLPMALGDRERLRQVLINLIDNAIKYNREGGRVEVSARRLPDGRIKVSVVDDGIGIAPEHVPRLTERFYRVDRSRSREQGGTGLGLAIVKHILGAHGSRLLVESTPGRGSTFGFTVPTEVKPSLALLPTARSTARGEGARGEGAPENRSAARA